MLFTSAVGYFSGIRRTRTPIPCALLLAENDLEGAQGQVHRHVKWKTVFEQRVSPTARQLYRSPIRSASTDILALSPRNTLPLAILNSRERQAVLAALSYDFCSGSNKLNEKRVGSLRSGLKLWMELCPDHKWVI